MKQQKEPPSGSAAKKRKYSRVLSFLLDYGQENTESSFMFDESESYTDTSSLIEEVFVQEDHSVNTDVPSQSILPVYPVKRNKKINIVEEDIIKKIYQTCSTLLKDKDVTPLEMYCLSLVEPLSAMSVPERERVKFEFSKVLKDARYNN